MKFRHPKHLRTEEAKVAAMRWESKVDQALRWVESRAGQN